MEDYRGGKDLVRILSYSTVRIETDKNDGKHTATGFFFDFFLDNIKNIKFPVIVTNKHTFEGANNIIFELSLKDEEGKLKYDHRYKIPIDLQNIHKYLIRHSDKDVDLCIFALAPILKFADTNNLKIYYTPLNETILPNENDYDEMSAIEKVLMIGYPNGICDIDNNLPIFRSGYTATDPLINYLCRSEFLIDVACYPGSSGSPVFIYLNTKLCLFGVLYAGYHNDKDKKIPNNLGVVIKIKRLLDFKEQIMKLKN